jgi:gamma-glutamyltranspeptidase/glutathione hydrolase
VGIAPSPRLRPHALTRPLPWPATLQVYIEEGIPPSTVEALRALGHDARPAYGFARSTLGRGQVIQQTIDATSGRRVWAAGSDLRGDGNAAAQI